MTGKRKIPKIRKRPLKAKGENLRRWRREQLLKKYLRRNLPELVIHCTNTNNIKSEQEEMIVEEPIRLDEIVKKDRNGFGSDTSSTTTASEENVNMDEVINESDKTMKEVNENTDPLSSSTETASEGEPYEK